MRVIVGGGVRADRPVREGVPRPADQCRRPGYTATDLNGFRGTQTVAGAAPIVAAALLAQDGPTGAFLDTAGNTPW
ncbi:MAG: hypothetical protein WBL53_03375 [Pseudonocardiaceae bacterium]